MNLNLHEIPLHVVNKVQCAGPYIEGSVCGVGGESLYPRGGGGVLLFLFDKFHDENAPNARKTS